MNVRLIIDVPVPWYASGIAMLGYVLAVVALAEAGVLRLLRWGTFRRSLLASFLMNLVSTLAGLLPMPLAEWRWLGVAVG